MQFAAMSTSVDESGCRHKLQSYILCRLVNAFLLLLMKVQTNYSPIREPVPCVNSVSANQTFDSSLQTLSLGRLLNKLKSNRVLRSKWWADGSDYKTVAPSVIDGD